MRCVQFMFIYFDKSDSRARSTSAGAAGLSARVYFVRPSARKRLTARDVVIRVAISKLVARGPAVRVIEPLGFSKIMLFPDEMYCAKTDTIILLVQYCPRSVFWYLYSIPRGNYTYGSVTQRQYHDASGEPYDRYSKNVFQYKVATQWWCKLDFSTRQTYFE